MSTTETQPQSNPPIGPNGDAKTVEAGTDPPYNGGKYKLEDFSQQRINRGQQRINYLIVEVNEKLVEALNQFKIAVAVCASNGTVNLGPVEAAINEVSEAADRIAGEFPPGCGDPS